jgi:hypothetical protein
MATKVLRAAKPNPLSQSGGDAFALAVARDSDARWELRVIAHLAAGARDVGIIYTCPRRSSGAPQTRVIAAGCLPGATKWEVLGRSLGSVEQGDIELDLSVGVGVQIPSFTDLERRPVMTFGGVDGLVQLLEGQRLRSFTARADALGATARILGGGTAMEVPAGGGITISPSIWNAGIEFIGTAAYIIEVEG